MMSGLPAEAASVVPSLPDETVVSVWPNAQITDPNWGGLTGLLVLTNRRCFFLKKKGVLSVSHDLKFVANLESMNDLSVKRGWIVRSVRIAGAEFMTDQPEAIQEAISHARAERVRFLETSKLGMNNAFGQVPGTPMPNQASSLQPPPTTIIVHGDYTPSKVHVQDSVVSRASLAASQPSNLDSRACGSCSYPMQPDWRLCPKCGAPQ
jgi:hypothetical protein